MSLLGGRRGEGRRERRAGGGVKEGGPSPAPPTPPPPPDREEYPAAGPPLEAHSVPCEWSVCVKSLEDLNFEQIQHETPASGCTGRLPQPAAAALPAGPHGWR